MFRHPKNTRVRWAPALAYTILGGLWCVAFFVGAFMMNGFSIGEATKVGVIAALPFIALLLIIGMSVWREHD
ncbi:MAG: hypothetical protein Q8R28_15015 [Dehalococcoidia bacterium]|nr:hypothetical protein [Dehalococcoidia bacterium]